MKKNTDSSYAKQTIQLRGIRIKKRPQNKFHFITFLIKSMMNYIQTMVFFY
jgi:hypothetical protein